MTVTLAYVTTTPAVAKPRPAGLLATVHHVAAGLGARYLASRQQAAVRGQASEVLRDAVRVRLMAESARVSNPGFAADLMAAADRAVGASSR